MKVKVIKTENRCVYRKHFVIKESVKLAVYAFMSGALFVLLLINITR